LIAAGASMKGAVDGDKWVKLAAELYCRLTAMAQQPEEHARFSCLTGDAPEQPKIYR
jgi:hypothetical protein